MPIRKVQFGKHEDVQLIEFGTGDILFGSAKESPEAQENLLVIYQQDAAEIGKEYPELMGLLTDEINGLKTVLKFTSVKSLTIFIHSLIELQQQML